MPTALNIRPATPDDHDRMWEILEPVISAGETYTVPRDWTKEQALNYWCSDNKHTFVAQCGEDILGTYYLRQNGMGGLSHIANCGYITGYKARGRGVASQMCEHSLKKAVELGYKAMQFNCVVSTNEGAVRLWHRWGFDTVGTLPKAFNHPTKGMVDAHVMFKSLV
ncbi:GNAT family N-acetyltransferase [Hirschia litorea]|uniref:GNAT family N-acetyltransferase n=1 Tax=Hirschia litorea TaxID=1199156 RepID=A0ABW2IKT6_9PROT